MFTLGIFLIYLLTAPVLTADDGFCSAEMKSCDTLKSDKDDTKLIFYDVNSAEGFNLRRDVYMRFAIMLTDARKSGKMKDWTMVLPPFYNLYHWRTDSSKHQPKPWGMFFDIESLKSYAPVVEMYEVFAKTSRKPLKIDVLYVLQNYENAFENGDFQDKWEVSDICDYDPIYWGYSNITAKEIICVKFQGKISMLKEVILLHPMATNVMFAHGEIPLHDKYGMKCYWDCRKSMKFNKNLVKIASEYMKVNLNCNIEKCTNYVSIHWRRQDFVRGRSTSVPSIKGTASQIDKFIKRNIPNVKDVFIASDASHTELTALETELKLLGYTVHFYLPSKEQIDSYKDGGIAIVEQIICSHAVFFIGTHESTFTYRIQEEREIIGFDSSTTFNRICPDHGKCETPSKWTIIN